MTIEESIEQYKLLKKSRKIIDKRLNELRVEILPYLSSGSTIAGLAAAYRDLTSYDEDKVWQLMDAKGVPHSSFTKKVVEPLLVEQLYLDGVLTDDDLRLIREPKSTYALVEVEDV